MGKYTALGATKASPAAEQGQTRAPLFGDDLDKILQRHWAMIEA